MIDISVANRSGAQVDEAGAVELARRVLAGEGVEEGELGLAFVGAEESRTLKREHLGIDEATDALAFPIDGREPVPEIIKTCGLADCVAKGAQALDWQTLKRSIGTASDYHVVAGKPWLRHSRKRSHRLRSASSMTIISWPSTMS